MAKPVDTMLPPPPASAPETARRTGRQRRPTGAPPPLPRKIGATGVFWLVMVVASVTASIVVFRSTGFLSLVDRVDTWFLQRLADVRVGWLTTAARAIKAAGSGWAVTVLGVGNLAALLVFRRWRHLLVLLGSVFVLATFGELIFDSLSRPRPYGVTIISGWGGFSMPSPPVAFLALVLVGLAYTLVVPGRPRWYAKVVLGTVLVAFALSRMYLAVDHPSDVVFGLILGVAIPVMFFRVFAPNEAFPVAYRRGKAAHLDVTGPRGEAIKRAVRDQLGLTVLELKPVGLEGSGGSTPLRLRIAGDPDTYLFAKLYAKNHVRADRSYKLWRTILYGRLEDETPFQTVRRFVEYEDHMLRLLRDTGIRTAAPYGFVEITPEREYMLVTEFFKGAEEIGDVEVDDRVIDEGLLLIRKLWDAGLSHRDIKPANLMVRDGEILLIDAFFVQVRPSPWRQAVDLGNMMLVLAVRSDPKRVYDRALEFFTPDEIAEAFAATQGVASPTQLRAFMKRDGRDLLAEFRALAPERRPIAIQRWSVRRVALAMSVLLLTLLATAISVSAFNPVQNLPVIKTPDCGANDSAVLMAQAVPSAGLVPCIALLPSGWSYGMGDVHTGEARFWLSSDQAGPRAVSVTLTPGCDVAGAERIPSDEVGTVRYEEPTSVVGAFSSVRRYVFPGGCATYEYRFPPGAPPTLAFEVDGALTFMPRATLVTHLERVEDLTLCGRGAPPCPG
jgi:membrane-associated phospholipid phosphatase/tRNA A-37 threonylcarbamoyl transferase component Bud32